MAELTYTAGARLRHDGDEYQVGDDVSHFAPLMPNLVAALSIGHVRLAWPDGTEVPARTEVRMNPTLWGLLLDDVKAAQTQETVETSAEAPLLPSPESDAEDEDEDLFDPADYLVGEVIAYAEANPDEVPALIAAEAAGKDRSTLLKRLDELAAE